MLTRAQGWRGSRWRGVGAHLGRGQPADHVSPARHQAWHRVHRAGLWRKRVCVGAEMEGVCKGVGWAFKDALHYKGRIAAL